MFGAVAARRSPAGWSEPGSPRRADRAIHRRACRTPSRRAAPPRRQALASHTTADACHSSLEPPRPRSTAGGVHHEPRPASSLAGFGQRVERGSSRRRGHRQTCRGGVCGGSVQCRLTGASAHDAHVPQVCSRGDRGLRERAGRDHRAVPVGTAVRRHDDRLGPPPGQIPASGTTPLGSHLGSWRESGRDARDGDEHQHARRFGRAGRARLQRPDARRESRRPGRSRWSHRFAARYPGPGPRDPREADSACGPQGCGPPDPLGGLPGEQAIRTKAGRGPPG
jgi:hypothetical protein